MLRRHGRRAGMATMADPEEVVEEISHVAVLVGREAEVDVAVQAVDSQVRIPGIATTFPSAYRL